MTRAATPLARAVSLDGARNVTVRRLAGRFHPAYGPALARLPAGRQVLDRPALDQQVTRGEWDEPADQVEGGGLAAARGTQQAEELARLDHHRNVVQGDRLAVPFRRVAELDGGCGVRQTSDSRGVQDLGRASVSLLCNRLPDASVRLMTRQYFGGRG